MWRRWLQFRLKTLFMVVTLCAIPLAWYAASTKQYWVEQRAIMDLKALANTRILVYDGDGFDSMGVLSGTVKENWQGPQWLERPMCRCRMPFLFRVEKVELFGSQFDDRIVEHISTFSSLKELELCETAISTDGLSRLKDALPRTTIVTRYDGLVITPPIQKPRDGAM